MNKQKLSKDPLNVIITGVGGQGNVLLAQLLGRALTKKGYMITVGDIFGAAQRGGSVSSHLRISEKDVYGPLTPGGTADLIVSLEPVEALRAVGQFGNPEVVVISNTRPFYPIDVVIGDASYPTLEEIKKAASKLSKESLFVDASAIALELKAPVVTNIVMGGVAIGTRVLPLSEDDFNEELKEQFAGRKPGIYELNKEAFRRGLAACNSLRS